ncbi:AAA family ATPase [Patescibacteria group bacterium]|nr:AAA family ATPase [Candidatus Paceibacterota bacterium]MBP9710578.1 AAA family ATPase [Patescibacteria group bacterium]
MRLRKLSIRNFRGIKSLDWHISKDFTLLVGPCDSTKSTILDAIELALLPRWQVNLDDSDFYLGDVAKPITIEVVISDVPSELKNEAKFGLDLSGWDQQTATVTDLEENLEEVMVLRFTTDESLEPQWLVISGRNPEGRNIAFRDREAFGLTRLGSGTDRQFTWGRGSLLSRLTESSSHRRLLAESARAARGAFQTDTCPGLKESVDKVSVLVQKVGLQIKNGLPGLDPSAVNLNSGAIALHQEGIPFRRVGLGSRMLFLVALQRELSNQGAVTIIDEVECGLEPYRLRNVLRILAEEKSCTVATSHSPIALQELGAKHIEIVRSTEGKTIVTSVPEQLQSTVQKSAEAFLSRRILVCEGMTELGFCRGLDDIRWSEVKRGLAYSGVSLADGRGDEAPIIATHFSQLGYEVMLLADSDKDTKSLDIQLSNQGVVVVRWEGGMSIEERIISDISWNGILEILAFAKATYGEDTICDRISNDLGTNAAVLGKDPSHWLQNYTEVEIRSAIAKAAKAKKPGWFKMAEYAHHLAEISLKNLTPDASTEKTLLRVTQWVTKT